MNGLDVFCWLCCDSQHSNGSEGVGPLTVNTRILAVSSYRRIIFSSYCDESTGNGNRETRS